jgi:asparagine synthase (glutamine-hydrolysing)
MFLPRLLKWDDRNFMAFAVEGRYPFLDHEVIETALSFSSRVLYSRGWTKEPLRRGAAGLVPHSIVRRRTKWGFETPYISWIRGPLRPALVKWLNADSPAWDFVSRAETEALAEEVWQRPNCSEEPAQMLMWAYFVDRWMRQAA